MKNFKSVLTFICLLCALSGFSQRDSSGTDKALRPLEDRKNELKLGAAKLIFGPVLDIEYERVASQYSSFGGNIAANLNTDNAYYNFTASPYFRMYFNRKRDYYIKGFFAQAFMGYYADKQTVYNYNYGHAENKTNSSLAAGLSIGSKWVNQRGFVFQFVLGAGRRIIGNDDTADLVYQADAYIGYRF